MPSLPKVKSNTQNAELKLVLYEIAQLEQLVKEWKCSQKPTSPGRNKWPARNRCVIITNVLESNNETSAERLLDDQAFLRQMISILFDKSEQVINLISAFCLGRKQEDLAKFRLLKIVCQAEEKWQPIWGWIPRLKGETSCVLKDFSSKSQVRMRQAVYELRIRRANGETDLYIVVFRIVRKTRR
ncbi:unnamed protein product, partial [Dicrocoelium dendriticum]